MKTPRLLTLLAVALFCAASPQSSPAADVVVDISSFAPRDPDAILAQIELNVLLKQYEKLLTSMEDYGFTIAFGHEIISADATDEQKKQAKERYEMRRSEFEDIVSGLEIRAKDCRARIKEIMSEANKRAAAFEKEQREAKKATGQSQANRGPLTLSGKSGDGNGGTLTFTGETNIVPAQGKGAANDPQTGTLRLTPGKQGTQTGTLEVIGGGTPKSGGTLILTGDPNKATPLPKDAW